MKRFDAIVVGAGHAGAEAAAALSRLGFRTAVLTLSLNAVAQMACNPNVGGTAKGHLVKEIDALGGVMGVVADKASLQIRMLNRGNGPAVHSLRMQVDKNKYHREMKLLLERLPNVFLQEGEVSELIVENGAVQGVKTTLGETFCARAVVLATGVYLKSRIIIGEYVKESGPTGFQAATKLTESLISLGIPIRRFKTGTPMRVNRRSVDVTKMSEQFGETDLTGFSNRTDECVRNDVSCYLTYTNPETHKIILENIDRAPMFNGIIDGVGPRYCPSVESKIVRFKDKDRHQIFVEPECADSDELYIQGMSTSLPFDVQEKMLHTVKGLEHAEITRYGYAIEYDAIDPTYLLPTLRLKPVDGLFSAGQLNGSSGYEEAAAQGLVAGLNAGRFLNGEEPVIFQRNESYIGVLIDDLVTKGTEEPYRMMTSRAEHRLHLRQDNADLRLTPLGYALGLVGEEQYARYRCRAEEIEKFKAALTKRYSTKEVLSAFEKRGEPVPEHGLTGTEILKRSTLDLSVLLEIDPSLTRFRKDVLETVAVEKKYEGYLKKEESAIAEAKKMENIRLSPDLDYSTVEGLKVEAQEKLNRVKPLTLAQASRISGVSPADVTVLLIREKRKKG